VQKRTRMTSTRVGLIEGEEYTKKKGEDNGLLSPRLLSFRRREGGKPNPLRQTEATRLKTPKKLRKQRRKKREDCCCDHPRKKDMRGKKHRAVKKRKKNYCPEKKGNSDQKGREPESDSG